MKILLKLFLLMAVAVCAQMAHAEGGCPPGSYPAAPPGAPAQVCAPIPGGSNGYSNGDSAPPVRWLNRWGSLVIGEDRDKSGILGKSSNMSDEKAAEEAAMQDCRLQGGGACKIYHTYNNACVALAVGDNPYGNASEANNNINVAKQRAMQRCTQRGGINCEVVYTACSLPVQVQ